MQTTTSHVRGVAPLAAALLLALHSAGALGAGPAAANMALASSAAPILPTEIAPPLKLALGKSSLLRVQDDLARIAVGDPETVDVILINPREVYLLGKHTGATNIFLWSKSGKTSVMDLTVSMDASVLRDKLSQLMPNEKDITVEAAGDVLVLSGQVADAVKVQRAMLLAEQFGGKKVLNLLRTGTVPQVMLEVKIAEVSKSLSDKLGVGLSGQRHAGNFNYAFLTSLLTGASNAVQIANGTTTITLDAERKNGLVKILAEPTIMAVSGQEGAFLAGGKIFIPVPQSGGSGANTITLEEKEFGVGLKFTPTVLEDGRINLHVTPEVSELSQVGTPFTSINGASAVLPTITTRRASTTVQLMDGQSFAIGGLIKNNVTQAVRAFPLLGEVPILGALFRSNEFQNDRSELLFIVTPRLVKPLMPDYALPTDAFIPPTRAELFLNGQMEGKPPAAPAAAPAARADNAGFEVK
jgi:pilus assembly protein CpaC